MKYLIQCRTSTAMPNLEYSLEFASDRMAIQYSERLIKQMIGVNWFMGFELWALEPERHVAFVRLGETEIRTQTDR